MTSFANKNAVWGLVMISLISGGGILAAVCVGLWYFMPHKGQVHWHTQVPILDSFIPVVLVAAFAVAGALIVAGVAGMAM